VTFFNDAIVDHAAQQGGVETRVDKINRVAACNQEIDKRSKDLALPRGPATPSCLIYLEELMASHGREAIFSPFPGSPLGLLSASHRLAQNFISQSFQSLTRLFLITPFARILLWSRKGFSAFSRKGYVSHDEFNLRTSFAALKTRPSPSGKNFPRTPRKTRLLPRDSLYY
jgi:hypothetical protein